MSGLTILPSCRFKALVRLPEDRRVILLNHLGFIQSRENCPEKENCVDIKVQTVLATKAHRYRNHYMKDIPCFNCMVLLKKACLGPGPERELPLLLCHVFLLPFSICIDSQWPF